MDWMGWLAKTGAGRLGFFGKDGEGFPGCTNSEVGDVMGGLLGIYLIHDAPVQVLRVVLHIHRKLNISTRWLSLG